MRKNVLGCSLLFVVYDGLWPIYIHLCYIYVELPLLSKQIMARILIDAIQNGQESLARDIIMKSGSFGGIDCQTSRRNGTALFFCSSHGYLELVKLLLDKGASVASTDKNGATPLHGAVDNGHLQVVKLLICHGANINEQTYRGDTPLHLAAYRGFGEITKCLMEAGADPSLLNSNSFTAENEARGRGHHDLCIYLRSGNNVVHLADRTGNLESMIQLDPPSVASGNTDQQADVGHQQSNSRDTKSQSHFDVKVRKKNIDYRSDTHLRSKSWDYGSDQFSKLSVMSLDSPSNISSHIPATNQRKRLSLRHSTGFPVSTSFFPSADGIAESQKGGNLPSPVPGLLTPSVMASSNGMCLNPTVTSNKHAPASSHFLFPLASNYSSDESRRQSTGSASSCFSDLGTGSDTGSLPSTGSDGSGFFSEIRRDDLELQDQHLEDHCTGELEQDNDLLLLSLGVRNPPVQKHKRQLSTTSESTESVEFSDIYDSTLFSLTSMISGSRSSLISGSSSATMDFADSDAGKNYSQPCGLELNHFRPRLNRATSANFPFPSSNVALKFRPGYNKSISTEYRPTISTHQETRESCPAFGRMPSNDLSSFSRTDKPTCSMTCVNIPLN